MRRLINCANIRSQFHVLCADDASSPPVHGIGGGRHGEVAALAVAARWSRPAEQLVSLNSGGRFTSWMSPTKTRLAQLPNKVPCEGLKYMSVANCTLWNRESLVKSPWHERTAPLVPMPDIRSIQVCIWQVKQSRQFLVHVQLKAISFSVWISYMQSLLGPLEPTTRSGRVCKLTERFLSMDRDPAEESEPMPVSGKPFDQLQGNPRSNIRNCYFEGIVGTPCYGQLYKHVQVADSIYVL